MNVNQKGNLTELKVITAAVEMGCTVCVPYGDCDRYDQIWDINGKLLRVQVKTSIPEERERYWIEYYGSFKNGYNATIGGDGRSYIDYDLIIATYQEVKNCAKVARILNIDCSTCSRVLKSRNIITRSSGEVTKEATQKSVAKIDKNTDEILEVFSCIHDAEKSIGIFGHISQVCKGKRKTCGGYKWKYL